jgi:hypothetical protein
VGQDGVAELAFEVGGKVALSRAAHLVVEEAGVGEGGGRRCGKNRCRSSAAARPRIPYREW